MMKPDLAHRLERVILNSLALDVAVTQQPISGGEIEIRSRDPNFAYPNGWSLRCDFLSELGILTFSFDSHSRALQDFYLMRFVESKDIVLQELARAIESGQEIYCLRDEIRFSLVELNSTTPAAPFQIVSKLLLRSQSGTASEESEYLRGILSFLYVCLLPLIPELWPEDLNDEGEGFPEGALTRILVNKYERSPKNRAACIAHYGACCLACGFDFNAQYGPLANGYIHVHHLTPISQLGPDYVINPTQELVPLCPNCHAMAHLKDPPFTVEELRQMVNDSTRFT